MENLQDLKRSAAQRVRELLPKATGWEEHAGVKIGAQKADLVMKFKLGGEEHTLLLEITSLGQPRQIREAITRLGELRAELDGAYPVAVAQYISPQGAGLLRRNGLGYLDLSGNCYLAFGNVLIEKEGKPNLRPSTRPLKSLFAPRATRVVRALLVEPGRLWRLDELARASGVSLGHAHNVVQRLGDLAWVDRGEQQRILLSKPAELLDAWVDAYTYRLNGAASYLSPERITRRLVGEIARAAQEEKRRCAFTLHAGAALVAPNVRMSAIHCYLEGDPEPVAKALGLRPGDDAGNVQLLQPYDAGVFHAPITKSGVPVVCLPQLYADLYHYERRGREQAAHLRREAMGF